MFGLFAVFSKLPPSALWDLEGNQNREQHNPCLPGRLPQLPTPTQHEVLVRARKYGDFRRYVSSLVLASDQDFRILCLTHFRTWILNLRYITQMFPVQHSALYNIRVDEETVRHRAP